MRYVVERYALAIETYTIDVDSAAEALEKLESSPEYGDLITTDTIQFLEEEAMAKSDFDDPRWGRLFEAYAQKVGSSGETLPTFRSVKNRDTGERWDRFRGYQPPTVAEHFPVFLKSKYYPVDIAGKIIYNDPAKREADCSVNRGYRGKGTIGVKGEHLNIYECYRTFAVVEIGGMQSA